MEKALLLVVVSSSFKMETLDIIRKYPGVDSAHNLYGPYDMFIMINAKDREELRALVIRVRETNGIKSTVTCNVIYQ